MWSQIPATIPHPINLLTHIQNRCLIIAAHGSRRTESNDSVSKLVDSLGQRLQNHYTDIKHAFLEFAQPDIGSAIDQAVAAGAQSIIVLPFFLSDGYHVKRDIPDIVDGKRNTYTQVVFEVLPHIGSSLAMASLIAGSVT